MKTVEYPAIFQPCSDGSWCVYFPDFQGCISWGDTLDEAKVQAKEALSLHILAMWQDNEDLPKASMSFSTAADDVVSPVQVPFPPIQH